jgi:glycosyltransferase involved in cell wall biosynthesis/peptidoglycan/xylan/chitin deacetylase (PgdA/CDA1 family)
MNKATLTIGIPAYNEEANITFLLNDILNQRQESFELKQILVYSDASTDHTVKLVRGFTDSRINLIEGAERKGLANGQNYIFSHIETDAAVLLDADILLPNTDFLEHLLAPIILGTADLSSATMTPLPPKTFFEKILLAGTKYKTRIFTAYRQGQNLYMCYGMARAFSKRLYSEIRFPYSIGEDMYSYLFCLSKGWQFKYVRETPGFFRLPNNFRDHFKQSTRFFISEQKFYNIFGKPNVLREIRLPKSVAITQALKMLISDPLTFPLYLAITLFTYVWVFFKPREATQEAWPIAESSKILKNDFSNSRGFLKNTLFRVFLVTRKIIYGILFFLRLFFPKNKAKILVFCYHSIAEDGWRFSIDFKTIKKQVDFLFQNFIPLTVSDLEAFISGHSIQTKPGFLICFDDGYKDILISKYYFQKLGIKPIVFALADPEHANRGELETMRELLSLNDLRQLKQVGWDIGCHSATHANFGALNPEGIRKEVADAKTTLEHTLGFQIKYFAYPKGIYNNNILSAAAQAGYSLAFSMDDGIISSQTNPLIIPRIGVDRTHNFYEFKALTTSAVTVMKKLLRKLLPANLL